MEKEVTVKMEGNYLVFLLDGKKVQSFPIQRALTRPGTIEDALIYLVSGHRVRDAQVRAAKEIFLNDQ